LNLLRSTPMEGGRPCGLAYRDKGPAHFSGCPTRPAINKTMSHATWDERKTAARFRARLLRLIYRDANPVSVFC
jgi:hypothetical protein